MLGAVLTTGVAMGAIYALIGIAYNVMYSTSKVMSFTAGHLGMVGAVFGAFFIGVLDWPAWIGAPAAIAAGGLTGYVTERVAVRPVLKKIDEHLYVLTTLALATMLQQGVAAWWGTEPRPFPALLGHALGWTDPKLWLPVVSVLVVLAGLELFYGRTLLGRSFVAVAEDAVAARTLGIPDDRVRVASYCLAGAVGALGGVAGGQLLHAFFALGGSLGYGFVAIAIGGLGSNRGAVLGGFGLGVLQQAANYAVGGLFVGIAIFAVFILFLLLLPQGLFGNTSTRRV